LYILYSIEIILNLQNNIEYFMGSWSLKIAHKEKWNCENKKREIWNLLQWKWNTCKDQVDSSTKDFKIQTTLKQIPLKTVNNSSTKCTP